MNQLPDFIKQVNRSVYKYRYSVCTLVTRKQEYLEMLTSFTEAGFTPDICEYLIVDNSEVNQMDAYEGINSFLQKASGEYIILCHQDIVLINKNSKQLLDEQIAQMDARDPKWGVLGNAGGANRLYKRMAIKIAYPGNVIDTQGTVPQEVGCIDENFMLVKNSANLALSGDIGGYHLYGFDLCMVANHLGYTAWVIDFLLMHKSEGDVNQSYHDILKRVKAKYTYFMRGRYVNTTIARFYLSGSKIKNILFHSRVFRRIVKTAEEIRWKLRN
ncbi:Glycosyltransferase like family protein [Mucilaginibacter pineti]|uniref:Glycosyltransferase like family protein n=1 Tax=Mucilaginibacter pineti TaxID=1391627 RepID=A0A1G7N1N3_9SPHI|nr:hypothetical protein [Mucilaginibacter pineti]SDF67816.1 Glycosyltransferase like family protein [Mucilaginibacter pineti]